MNKRTEANQSVEKALKIIDVLAHSPCPMRLLDISNAVDIPKSTALRMLSSLQKYGYVYQEEEMKRYALTLRILHIGQLAAEKFGLRSILHPYLTKISQISSETCCAAAKETDAIRYVDVIENSVGMVSIRQSIGGIVKMHCTGSGKLFLMDYSQASFEKFIKDVGLPKMTDKTITDASLLLMELKKCKENGFALDNEEYTSGVKCISVPVHGADGNTLVAISISGPVVRMGEDRINDFLLPLLKDTAREIEHSLGYC